MDMSTAGLLCITGHLPAPAPADPTPDWSPKAGCRGMYKLFDDALGQVGKKRSNAVTDLQNICLDCPVRRLCLNSGLDTKSWGVWGGFYLYAGKPPASDRSAVENFLAGVDPLTVTPAEPAVTEHPTAA